MALALERNVHKPSPLPSCSESPTQKTQCSKVGKPPSAHQDIMHPVAAASAARFAVSRPRRAVRGRASRRCGGPGRPWPGQPGSGLGFSEPCAPQFTSECGSSPSPWPCRCAHSKSPPRHEPPGRRRRATPSAESEGWPGRRGARGAPDGWSDVQRRPITNFMLVTRESAMFMKSISQGRGPRRALPPDDPGVVTWHGALRGAGRGALVSAPQRPCQPCC